MSLTLLVLAAAAPDLAFDAYGKCAQGAAAAYKGPTDTLEAVVGRIETDCAADRTTLLQVAPDRGQATEWLRMTTTLAVSQHVRGLPSAGSEPREAQAAATPAASRYPKLDAYRLCTEESAATIEAELPYVTAQAIAGKAVADCEKPLKAAAEETVAEMRQPSLKPQVTGDFRRRITAELVQKISAGRTGRKAATQ